MDKFDKLTAILNKAKEQLEKALPKRVPGIPGVTSWDHSAGAMPEDHPERPKVVAHITDLSRSNKPGAKLQARQHYENYIDGKPGVYTKGITEKNDGCDEMLEMSKNGQWNLVKISETPNKVEGRDDKITDSQSISEVPNKVTGAEDAVKR